MRRSALARESVLWCLLGFQTVSERSRVHCVCVCVYVLYRGVLCVCACGNVYARAVAGKRRSRDANLGAEMTSFPERYLGALNLISYSMFFVCTRIGYARVAPFADTSWPMVGDRVVYLWTLPMFHCNGWCFPWAVTAGEWRQNRTCSSINIIGPKKSNFFYSRFILPSSISRLTRHVQTLSEAGIQRRCPGSSEARTQAEPSVCSPLPLPNKPAINLKLPLELLLCHFREILYARLVCTRNVTNVFSTMDSRV